MVVNKPLRKRHAVLALFITLVIFIMGGLLGYAFNVEKSKLLENQAHEMRNEVQNLQIQLLYLDSLGTENSCALLESTVESTSVGLDELGKRLKAYEDAQDFGSDFVQIKDEYSFLELRTWLFYHKLRNDCDTDNVDIVYIFSSTGCDGCLGQGKILDSLKRDLGDRLLVFSIDINWDQPVFKAFLKDFNVDNAPALIINGNTHPYVESAQLKQVVCNEYSNKPSAC